MIRSVTLKPASTHEHFLFLFETRTSPLVDHMLSGSPPANYEQHGQYLAKVLGNTHWIFIAYNDAEEAVGYSQVYDVTERHFEVGFAIHPNFQGKGYGKHLVRATIDAGRRLFPARKVVLYVKPTNHKAIHIYETCGFIAREGASAGDQVFMELETM